MSDQTEAPIFRSSEDDEPLESRRGDEYLCAKCATHPGEEYDAEGRLVCTHCAAELDAKE